MISKKSLVAVLDKSIILTITFPNDNANQDPVQCAPCVDSFYTLSVDKTRHLLTPSPHLVHVVIEWPLIQMIHSLMTKPSKNFKKLKKKLEEF